MITDGGRQAARLRSREAARARRDPGGRFAARRSVDRRRHQPGGHAGRHDRLHVARTTRRARRGRADRHLRARPDRLRDDHRAARVRQRQPGGTDCGDPQRGSAADDDAPAEDASGGRAHHHHRPRQGSGEALAGRRRSRARVVVGHHRFAIRRPETADRPSPSPVWRPWTIAAAAVIVAAIGTTGIVWRIRDADSAIRNPQSAVRNLVVLPCRASGDAVDAGVLRRPDRHAQRQADAAGRRARPPVDVDRGGTGARRPRRRPGPPRVRRHADSGRRHPARRRHAADQLRARGRDDAPADRRVLSHRGGGRSVRPPGSRHFVGRGRAGHAVERRRAADAERVRNTCARGSRSVS